MSKTKQIEERVLSMANPKYAWNDEKIKQGVKRVIVALNLDRMPSQSECIEYYGNYCLSNAVAKRKGGWYGLAREMGFAIKESETLLGKTQEGVVCEFLKARGFEVERMPQNFPYDLLVDNCVKVDVKASHLYTGKQGSFYTFNLEKRYATCDVYVLLALDDDDEIVNVYVVPSKFVISNTQISIGQYKSKYHQFMDRWDYISNMSGYLSAL
jgi:hypothetical protein